jgi:hypothetical protein
MLPILKIATTDIYCVCVRHIICKFGLKQQYKMGVDSLSTIVKLANL